MPNVSIIVPFYNNIDKIEQCINSILNQKYKDIEIILINDNSTKYCEHIITKYRYNPKIRYFFIDKKTVGVGYARNYGIEKSKGKYIMFVDVDDCIDEYLLANMDYYMKEEIDLIKYNLKCVNKLRNRDLDYFIKKNYDILDGSQAFNKICFSDKFLDSPCVYLIKRELLKNKKLKFTENIYHEDFDLIPFIIINANSVVLSEYVGYYYIQTKNSIMRNNDYKKTLERFSNKISIYEKMIKRLENINIDKKTKENFKLYYINSIIISLDDLRKNDRNYFIRKIKNIGILENLKSNNIKRLIKKFLLNIDINLYLNLRRFLLNG